MLAFVAGKIGRGWRFFVIPAGNLPNTRFSDDASKSGLGSSPLEMTKPSETKKVLLILQPLRLLIKITAETRRRRVILPE